MLGGRDLDELVVCFGFVDCYLYVVGGVWLDYEFGVFVGLCEGWGVFVEGELDEVGFCRRQLPVLFGECCYDLGLFGY